MANNDSRFSAMAKNAEERKEAPKVQVNTHRVQLMTTCPHNRTNKHRVAHG